MSRRISKVLSVSLGTNEIAPVIHWPNIATASTKGNPSFTTTVLESVAVTETIGALGLAAFATAVREAAVRTNLSHVKATSFASRGRPLTGGLFCHFTP